MKFEIVFSLPVVLPFLLPLKAVWTFLFYYYCSEIEYNFAYIRPPIPSTIHGNEHISCWIQLALLSCNLLSPVILTSVVLEQIFRQHVRFLRRNQLRYWQRQLLHVFRRGTRLRYWQRQLLLKIIGPQRHLLLVQSASLLHLLPRWPTFSLSDFICLFPWSSLPCCALAALFLMLSASFTFFSLSSKRRENAHDNERERREQCKCRVVSVSYASTASASSPVGFILIVFHPFTSYPPKPPIEYC